MILLCRNCQREFGSDKKKKKYCSLLCYAQARQGRYPESLKGKRGKKPRKRVNKKCVICKRSYEVWVGRAGTSKYCSKRCWRKRNPPFLSYCLYCGKDFWEYKSEGKKYCSRKCFKVHKRELLKGRKSHFWKGGKTKVNQILRSRAEYSDWRNAVFVRDDYTCQSCGMKSQTGQKVFLHAHHIKPISVNPELIYDINNGITMCKNCHLLKHNHQF